MRVWSSWLRAEMRRGQSLPHGLTTIATRILLESFDAPDSHELCFPEGFEPGTIVHALIIRKEQMKCGLFGHT